MTATELATGYVSLVPSFKGGAAAIRKELDGAAVGDRAGRDAGRGFTAGFGGGLKKLGGVLAAAFAGAKVAEFFGGSISQARDLQETLSKSTVIFGENAAAIEKWGDGAAKAIGLSKNEAIGFAAQFGDMFSQLGFGANEAAKLSKSVVQMSADLGSFNNLGTDDVAERISAAFRGEYDSLQLLIPNINAARVEQEAMAMTGKSNAKSLTAQETAAATLAIVQKDGARAQGDFARTSDGLANQQKILSAQTADLQAKIGKALVPALADGAKWANTKLFPALGRVGKGVGAVGDLLLKGDFSARFREVFKVGEDSKLVDVLFRIRDGAIGLFKLFKGGDFTSNLRQAFGVSEDSKFVDTLLRIRETVIQVFGSVVSTIRSALSIVQSVWKIVWGTLGPAITGAVLPAINAVMTILSGAYTTISGIFKLIAAVLKGDWGAAWEAVKQIVAGAWELIKGTIALGWTAVKLIFQSAVAVLKAVVSGLWSVVKALFAAGWQAIKSGASAAWQFVKDKTSDVIGFFKGVPKKITDATKGMWDGIKSAFRSAINWVIDKWNGLEFKIPAVDTHIPGVGKIGGFSLGTPNIPRLADGGITSGPTLAWIGEGREQEAVIPLSKLASMLSDGVGKPRDGDQPVYTDFGQLVGWIRRLANGEARLVWAEAEMKAAIEEMYG